jgi:hypothetical protein
MTIISKVHGVKFFSSLLGSLSGQTRLTLLRVPCQLAMEDLSLFCSHAYTCLAQEYPNYLHRLGDHTKMLGGSLILHNIGGRGGGGPTAPLSQP